MSIPIITTRRFGFIKMGQNNGNRIDLLFLSFSWNYSRIVNLKRFLDTKQELSILKIPIEYRFCKILYNLRKRKSKRDFPILKPLPELL